MTEKKRQNTGNFLVQGSILAVASVVSRIIGLFYRIPFTNIVGDLGNNYYGTAFKIYNILLIISSYSLPLAVSKLVSSNMAQGRRRNVYRILKCALVFGGISGTLAALVLYVGAEFITSTIMSTPLSIFAVKTLVPVLIIVAILGVMRGFFQGLGTMMPSAISQIFEQIVNAIVSIWAAYVLYSYGAKVGAVLGNPENLAAAYGAAGGTIGTGSGAAAALIFVTFVLVTFLGRFKRSMRRDASKRVDSYGTIFKMLFVTIIPVLLSSTIYNCNSIIDEAVYKKIAFWQGYSDSVISVQNGIFSGKYQTLINIPISIAAAVAASSVPALTAAYAENDSNAAKKQIALSTRFIMIISFPCAVGMGVLASPILNLLFHDTSDLAGRMVTLGAISIVFFALSTLSNGLLQGIGRMREPIKNAVIALILHVIVLVALMMVLDLNIYAVVIANAVFGLFMCLLNAYSIHRYSGYEQEIKKTFLVPAAASAIMGVTVWLLYRLLQYIFRINAISTLVSIVVGAIVYAVFLLRFGGLNEHELYSFPKGRTLAVIAKKLHLL